MSKVQRASEDLAAKRRSKRRVRSSLATYDVCQSSGSNPSNSVQNHPSFKHRDETTMESFSTSALSPSSPMSPTSLHMPDIQPAPNFDASLPNGRYLAVDSDRTAVVRARPRRRGDPCIHGGSQRDSAAWPASRALRNHVYRSCGCVHASTNGSGA